jgi:uncharacterized protein YdhG (YjbR/CyaY superfamily)
MSMPRSDAPATQRIDEYIAALEPPFRKALTRLRAVLRDAAPEAEEVVSYSMPGIGRYGALVTYDAFARHYSLFPMGNSVLNAMSGDIAPWRKGPGTLQFTLEDELPEALIRRIVEARLAENAGRAAARRRR